MSAAEPVPAGEAVEEPLDVVEEPAAEEEVAAEVKLLQLRKSPEMLISFKLCYIFFLCS